MTDNRNLTGSSLPIRTNNPFALKDAGESWEGLAGTENGFYVFESKEYGTRAGLIVLYNGYIKQNLLTPYNIFQKYAPASDNNDVENYAIYIADKLGNGGDANQGINTGIQRCQWRDVARWIPVYESGENDYYNYEELDKGLELVKSHPSYDEIYSFFSENCPNKPGIADKIIAKSGISKKVLYSVFIPLLGVLFLTGMYFVYKRLNR